VFKIKKHSRWREISLKNNKHLESFNGQSATFKCLKMKKMSLARDFLQKI